MKVEKSNNPIQTPMKLIKKNKNQAKQIIRVIRISLQRLLRGMQRFPDETAPHQGKQATMASSCSYVSLITTITLMQFGTLMNFGNF